MVTSVKLECIDLDKRFRDSDNPVLLNDIIDSDIKDHRKIIRELFQVYDNNEDIDNAPSCTCGHLVGGWKLNEICKVCNTPVKAKSQTMNLEYWIEAPIECPYFIMPKFYAMLNSFLGSQSKTTTNISLLDYILDPTYRLPMVSKAIKVKLNHLASSGWVRGYKYFIEHFDEFVERILPRLLSNKATQQPEHLFEFIHKNRSVLFPRHLPFPDKKLLVLENDRNNIYTIEGVNYALDALFSLSSLRIRRITNHLQIEKRVLSIVRNLTFYYTTMMSKNFLGKKKILYGHVYSTRAPYSFRTVIVSNHKEHDYECMTLPWCLALETFRYKIIARLIQKGYNHIEAYVKIENGFVNEDQELFDIVDELIVDAKKNWKGIPVLFVRNPTLTRASIQALFIDRIKKDIHDYTIELSVLALIGPNADFDGDAMNGVDVLDQKNYEEIQYLRPHYSIFDIKNFGMIGKNISLPDVTLANIHSWLHT